MVVDPLAGSHLGGSGDDFVMVQWTAEVGDHWIAPLHVHHEDDEAWYVRRGKLGFRLGDEEVEAGPGSAVLARRGTPLHRSFAAKAAAVDGEMVDVIGNMSVVRAFGAMFRERQRIASTISVEMGARRTSRLRTGTRGGPTLIRT